MIGAIVKAMHKSKVTTDPGVFYAPYIPKIQMNNSKYKFSRAKWYQAYFDSAYYHQVFDWCEQHFGKHDHYPNAWSRWNHKFEDSILFRDEKDYVFFMLRWSS